MSVDEGKGFDAVAPGSRSARAVALVRGGLSKAEAALRDRTRRRYAHES